MEYNPNPAVPPLPVQSPAEQHRKDAVTAMVLGIVGLALAWLGVFTIATLILSIIALVRAKKNREFAQSIGIPEASQNRAGFICGLIGLILSAIILCAAIFACIVAFSFLRSLLPGFFDLVENAHYMLSGHLICL